MDKSIMKKTYKEAKRPMGVYRITSTLNDKAYIGFGIDLPAKINRHKAELRFGSHRNIELQEAWRLLGESAVDFEVLDVLDHQENSQTDPSEELQILLQMWIRKLEKEGCSVVTL
jgi:hypothetical protein